MSETSSSVARPVPRATYRLQLNADFGFREAAAVVPYVARLGVSHVYASPFLRARPGSTHGYDIVDHGELNPELGSKADFDAFVETLRAHELGMVLDFVPNHMGIGGSDNPYWLDVLEWGRSSDYAGWFDIDWFPEAPHLEGKVLIPVLGDHYGKVLESGGLELRFDAEEGSIALWAYGTHKLPIHPDCYGAVLGTGHAALERLGDAFTHLSAYHPHEQRRARELKRDLARLAADPQIRAAIDASLAGFAGREGDLDSWSRLDRLVEEQVWRVAFFRVAADDINYRRFFNVNELAGIRIEHEELFEHAHRLVFDLIGRGVLDGLRIDHIDGLLDPKTYCHRLRQRAPRPIWLVVEKILAEHETLRADWGTDGTTGYEFANLLTGLLTDPAGDARITSFYRSFTGERARFSEIVRASKFAIMDDEMASELNTLARDAARIARSGPRTADFTQNVLRRALKEIVAAFEVYRTYVTEDGTCAQDLKELDGAITRARRNARALDPSVFDFLGSLLSARLTAAPGSGYSRQEVLAFAMRFQQYTGPVMAKGLEDTAFYRFNRFVAANEVGGEPAEPTTTIEAFHTANARRLAETPGAMLATSTHDTKRGEDTRARLAVLAEVADEFTAAVTEWSAILAGEGAGTAGGEGGEFARNDEYLLYQLLIGAWPSEAEVDDAALGDFRARLSGAMLKSVREAKVRSNWAAPDTDYEAVVEAFIERAFASAPFRAAFLPFQKRIARLGAVNSYVQTVLKLTVPGVPDIYRGAEHWDLSLVDPDNRRPVDFELRQRLLDDPSAPAAAEALGDGSAKLRAIAALLALRAERPALFAAGDYLPLDTGSDQIIGFERRHGAERLIVLARRFPSRGVPAGTPAIAGTGAARLVLGAGTVDLSAGPTPSELLADLPAVVLLAGVDVAAGAAPSSGVRALANADEDA
ncbi:malto-oligosyltrehalose synthase [Methylobrevis pamukkalensis]|uniref:Maltooligosyl trehalose synthase n=1 Tax=Methylobrevis pamukkalensis TaxID=1439726 RepID=A0A1E3GY21_9HYPH|nr:malto-oligosyltrehalose synthase [Methylobrevis pamukkalensis]ODN68958.1 Maltooligosyl trehalose synthase [Methylobrevis pamukkalensis]